MDAETERAFNARQRARIPGILRQHFEREIVPLVDHEKFAWPASPWMAKMRVEVNFRMHRKDDLWYHVLDLYFAGMREEALDYIDTVLVPTWLALYPE